MKILLRRSLDLSYICWFESFIKILWLFLFCNCFSSFLNSVVKIIPNRILSLIWFWVKPPLRINSLFPIACPYLIWSPRISSSRLISLSPTRVVFHCKTLYFWRNTWCSLLNSRWNLLLFWRALRRGKYIYCKLFQLSWWSKRCFRLSLDHFNTK